MFGTVEWQRTQRERLLQQSIWYSKTAQQCKSVGGFLWRPNYQRYNLLLQHGRHSRPNPRPWVGLCAEFPVQARYSPALPVVLSARRQRQQQAFRPDTRVEEALLPFHPPFLTFPPWVSSVPRPRSRIQPTKSGILRSSTGWEEHDFGDRLCWQSYLSPTSGGQQHQCL